MIPFEFVNEKITNRTEIKYEAGMVYLLNWKGEIVGSWPSNTDTDLIHKRYESEFYEGERKVAQANREVDGFYQRMLKRVLDEEFEEELV